MTRRIKFLIAVLATATFAVTVAACGSSGSTDSPTVAASAASHNNADVTFAQQMIPHHAQAVDMATLALSKSKNAEVLDLARRIKSAQDPEITTMTSWLRNWHADVPDTNMDMSMNMEGMDHSGAGMMSADQMNGLRTAAGTAFDRLFLSLMIEHHKGAIAMAKTEQSSGKFPGAVALAGRIVSAQQAEIQEMTRLLSR